MAGEHGQGKADQDKAADLTKQAETAGGFATTHGVGGWIALGKTSKNDWPFVASEFIARYRNYAGRGLVPKAPS